MICIGCKYYDNSVDCCNADENCYQVGYQNGKVDAIEKMKSLIFEFDDYCDMRKCSDCWMYISDESCLKQWINSKFDELKENANE